MYVGFVVGLDYEDPRLTPFEAFQQFKHHPQVKPLLEGGEILAAGARTIAAGGWQSIPRLEMPGAMLIGDSGGGVNCPRSRAFTRRSALACWPREHLAETGSPEGFDARWRASPGGQELQVGAQLQARLQARHVVRHGQFGPRGGHGRPHALDAAATGPPDHARLEKLDEYDSPDRQWVERTLPPRDRLASVFFASTTHDENQPAHLKVLDTHDLHRPLRGGVRQSLPALLPGERL